MIRLILLVPFLLALILFAASNQESSQMWFLTYSWSSSVGVLALLIAFGGLLLGAFGVWVSELNQRRRARKAEARNRELEATVASQTAELERLQAQARLAMATNASPAVITSITPITPSSSSGV
ncbi:MAG: lipopolysaccharide assembly protein LapA domain-containing protein [Acetobacter aceti]|uniref:Lipopolysaccharide assembly protein A domain-containing protein n=1 Tax=Acetobacter aceti TaxID=435 RepID=A0A1U9KJK5_ACEAC|nr:lipopolysaccharide assembly protein LapA domain-containing protein [Acetobacter aceti]AQS85992.1 hypothetical protein A0U92_15910 [Acetobacter aceti]